MTPQEHYDNLATKLEEVLMTVVSTKLLEILSSKQRGMLEYQYELIKGLRKFEMDEEDEEDVERYIKTIKSILDFAKRKLPSKQYHGTGQYNAVN